MIGKCERDETGRESCPQEPAEGHQGSPATLPHPSAESAPTAPTARLFGAPDRDSTSDVRVNRANRWLSFAPHVIFTAMAARLALPRDEEAELAEAFVDAVIDHDTATVGMMLGMAFAEEFAIADVANNRVHLHFAHSDDCGDFMRRYLVRVEA